MFSIRNFIMNTLYGMHGNYPDFQIREYALNWYAKGKLTEDDLIEIESMLNPMDMTEDVDNEEDIDIEEDGLNE